MIEQKINAKGNTCWDVRRAETGPILGTVFSTSLSTLPFEAFSYRPSVLAHRCATVEEGEEWILNRVVTVDELQALPDSELNALAAKLRGWTTAFGGIEIAGETVREHHFEGRDKKGELGAIISVHDWMPATDRNQSGELLQWAAKRGGEDYAFSSDLATFIEFQAIFQSEEISDPVEVEPLFSINEYSARSETIAFCAAMLALEASN